MTKQYKIKIVKETFIDLESDREAEQVADLLASRENKSVGIGTLTFVYADYEPVPA